MGKLISKYIFRVKCTECKKRMKRTMSFYDKYKRKYYCSTCVPNDLFKTSIYGLETQYCKMYNTDNIAVGLYPDSRSI